MGMFDIIWVNFKCPVCGHYKADMEFQTKDGVRGLCNYQIGDTFFSDSSKPRPHVGGHCYGECELCESRFDAHFWLDKEERIESINIYNYITELIKPCIIKKSKPIKFFEDESVQLFNDINKLISLEINMEDVKKNERSDK